MGAPGRQIIPSASTTALSQTFDCPIRKEGASPIYWVARCKQQKGRTRSHVGAKKMLLDASTQMPSWISLMAIGSGHYKEYEALTYLGATTDISKRRRSEASAT